MNERLESAGQVLRSGAVRVAGRVRNSALTLTVFSLGVAIIAGLAVLPARTWMSQRDATETTRLELEQLEATVAELDAQLQLLRTDGEVERQARENYDLVYPGEESYRILPSPEG